MLASLSCNYDIVEQLVLEGKSTVNVNEKDKFGVTALMFAASKGEFKICKLLLENKASINALSQSGQSALMRACASMYINSEELLTLFHQYRAKLDLQNNDGYSALHIAVQNDNIRIAEKLIEFGANINLQTKEEGDTPLMLCAK